MTGISYRSAGSPSIPLATTRFASVARVRAVHVTGAAAAAPFVRDERTYRRDHTHQMSLWVTVTVFASTSSTTPVMKPAYTAFPSHSATRTRLIGVMESIVTTSATSGSPTLNVVDPLEPPLRRR